MFFILWGIWVKKRGLTKRNPTVDQRKEHDIQARTPQERTPREDFLYPPQPYGRTKMSVYLIIRILKDYRFTPEKP